MAGAAGAHDESGVEWILDVAHNPAGAWALRAGLRERVGRPTGQGR